MSKSRPSTVEEEPLVFQATSNKDHSFVAVSADAVAFLTRISMIPLDVVEPSEAIQNLRDELVVVQAELASIYLSQSKLAADIDLWRNKKHSIFAAIKLLSSALGPSPFGTMDLISPPQTSNLIASPPENMDIIVPPPENMDVIVPPPENMDLNGPPPENMDLNGPPPENMALNAPPPENMVLNAPPPENMALNAPPHENMALNAPPPENMALNAPPPVDMALNAPPPVEMVLNAPPPENMALNAPPPVAIEREETMNVVVEG